MRLVFNVLNDLCFLPGAISKTREAQSCFTIFIRSFFADAAACVPLSEFIWLSLSNLARLSLKTPIAFPVHIIAFVDLLAPRPLIAVFVFPIQVFHV